MKIRELKNRTKEELEEMLRDFRSKLRELRFNIRLKQFKNVREIRKTKKLIAQILTLLNQQKDEGKAKE